MIIHENLSKKPEQNIKLKMVQVGPQTLLAFGNRGLIQTYRQRVSHRLHFHFSALQFGDPIPSRSGNMIICQSHLTIQQWRYQLLVHVPYPAMKVIMKSRSCFDLRVKLITKCAKRIRNWNKDNKVGKRLQIGEQEMRIIILVSQTRKLQFRGNFFRSVVEIF